MSAMLGPRRRALVLMNLAGWALAGCGGGAAPQPVSAPAPAPAPSPADFSPPGYQLAFSDEFDGDSLDRTKWCTRHVYSVGPPLQVPDDQCTRGNRSGTLDHFNDEQQRYRDFNLLGEPMHVVSAGTLKLRATKTGPAGSAPYESSMLRSKLDFTPTPTTSYYVTAKFKPPNVLGAWPAYWLVGGWGTNDTLQWPPEIDIMEAPVNELDMRANSLGQGTQMQGGLQTASRRFEFTYTGPDYDARSRIYSPARLLRDVWLEVGVLWTATSVCFFVDGVKTACENYNWVDDAGHPANAAHLILNLAIGGAWAGASGIDDTKFPTQVEVDHVRVYRSAVLNIKVAVVATQPEVIDLVQRYMQSAVRAYPTGIFSAIAEARAWVAAPIAGWPVTLQ